MKKTRKLFYSKQDRLFPIWSILRLLIIWILLFMIYSILARLLFNVKNIDLNSLKLLMVASVILVTILFDKEKIESLGIELKIRSIIFFIIGIIWAYFCCVQIEIIGLFTSNSGFQLVNPLSKIAILSLVHFLFIISLPEELLFRSYLISNISRAANSVIALLISFVLFTILHLITGSWTNITDGLAYGLIFTLLCGLTFLMTKNIFLAVGFHGAWDTYLQLFESENLIISNINTIFIVWIINIFVFYLIYKKIVNFDIKTLIKHRF